MEARGITMSYLQTINEIMDEMSVFIEIWFFLGNNYYIVFKRIGTAEKMVRFEYSLPINLLEHVRLNLGFGVVDGDSIKIDWDQEDKTLYLYKGTRIKSDNNFDPNTDMLTTEYVTFMMR